MSLSVCRSLSLSLSLSVSLSLRRGWTRRCEPEQRGASSAAEKKTQESGGFLGKRRLRLRAILPLHQAATGKLERGMKPK